MKLKPAAILSVSLLFALVPAATPFSEKGIANADSKTTQQRTAVSPAVWAAAAPSIVKEVKASITAQLKAFKKDDYEQASLYQSAALKQNFGNVTLFKMMMKRAYPEFADYKSVTFGPVYTTQGGSEVQAPVVLIGADNVKVAAIYLMVKEEGGYRVAGVVGGNMTPPLLQQADPTIS